MGRHEVVVIGGGIAGLVAAARLAELGYAPFVIEGGSYPTHKVCGEFFSPSCMPLLHQWNIHPILLQKAYIHAPHWTISFSFPQSAGSLSHLTFDPALVDYATHHGAHIYTGHQVQHISPKSNLKDVHKITLSSGEIIEATSLIIATGRLGSYLPSSAPQYIGFKAHFKDIPTQHQLEMFIFSGAYLGIVPVEEGCFNIACLARRRTMKSFTTVENFIDFLSSQHALLKFYLSKGHCLFDRWLTADIPHFGKRALPDWLDTYFIGDAAGTIPPASGNGLAMAIDSGYRVTNYVIERKYQDFKKFWQKRYGKPIFWAKLLHQALMHPSTLHLAHHFPALTSQVFQFTRQH